MIIYVFSLAGLGQRKDEVGNVVVKRVFGLHENGIPNLEGGLSGRDIYIYIYITLIYIYDIIYTYIYVHVHIHIYFLFSPISTQYRDVPYLARGFGQCQSEALLYSPPFRQ